jgi:CBS domain-containing protein
MTTELDAAGIDASLDEVALLLERRKISAVPLLAADGTIAGVLSRSDLLRVGRLHAGRHTGARVVSLPDGSAGSLVSRAPLVCPPQMSLREAARIMLEHGVHRLFVVRDRRPIGVISTLDLTAAVRDARVALPLAEVMTTPVVTVAIDAPVGAAAELLARTRVTSLIVVDERWPLGVLSQADVLAASMLPATTRVDDVMDPAVICMPARTCVHHAAAVAANLQVRRVAVSADREMVGIVGGLDFARVVAA